MIAVRVFLNSPFISVHYYMRTYTYFMPFCCRGRHRSQLSACYDPRTEIISPHEHALMLSCISKPAVLLIFEEGLFSAVDVLRQNDEDNNYKDSTSTRNAVKRQSNGDKSIYRNVGRSAARWIDDVVVVSGRRWVKLAQDRG